MISCVVFLFLLFINVFNFFCCLLDEINNLINNIIIVVKKILFVWLGIICCNLIDVFNIISNIIIDIIIYICDILCCWV